MKIKIVLIERNRFILHQYYLPRDHLQLVEKIKEEKRRQNSELLQDKPIYTAVDDGWETRGVDSKVLRHQCAVQATAGNTPIVCELFTKSWHW